MEWYYALGDERKGPVQDEEFQRLIKMGIITRETLVWNETMDEWQPCTAAPATGPTLLMTAEDKNWLLCGGCRVSYPISELVPISGTHYCASCKATAFQKVREGAQDGADEQIRKKHLNHEASVKSVGTIYIATAILMCIGAAGLWVLKDRIDLTPKLLTAIVIGTLVLGIFQLSVGVAVRRLRRWARIPVGILSGIGLFNFPYGSLVNAYILYLIFCKKSATVFSDDYAGVMERTPHIRFRFSILTIICLGILAFFVLVGAFFVVTKQR